MWCREPCSHLVDQPLEDPVVDAGGRDAGAAGVSGEPREAEAIALGAGLGEQPLPFGRQFGLPGRQHRLQPAFPHRREEVRADIGQRLGRDAGGHRVHRRQPRGDVRHVERDMGGDLADQDRDPMHRRAQVAAAHRGQAFG